MFGSISNWISTNMPEVPSVNMPTVNLPKMPDMPKMPDIFSKKNNEATTTAENEEAAGGVATGEQVDVTNESAVASQISPQQDQSEEVGSDALAVAGTDADAASTSSKFANIHPGDITQKAFGNAKELGSNIGNMLFSFGKKASNNVMNTANQLKDVIEKKTIIGDFTKENEKFVNEKKNQQRREDAAVPPWVGYNEEEMLKEQITALSTDSRNFLRSPPTGVDFQFDFNVAYPIALATLEEDANLKDMRFKLVPAKINEESFWRNYFYRVTLIKQSILLDQTYATDKEGGQEGGISHQDSAGDVEEEAEWDKELPEDLDSISPEELEKEINQMIGK